LRYFQKLVKGHILAFQLYSYRTLGQTSLRELAALGGPNNLRGFYQGRYRDQNMFSFITEYRVHIYKRFSACFFGGLGTVYNSSRQLLANNLKYSGGGGLRFSLLEKEKLNIRLDYGYSNHLNKGFYFTVGECF
jgi:hemolysin activation/secretion protein